MASTVSDEYIHEEEIAESRPVWIEESLLEVTPSLVVPEVHENYNLSLSHVADEDILKNTSKCEKDENEITDSNLNPSTYSFMLTRSLLHHSIEDGDIVKVLAHCKLMFLTLGHYSTYFGFDLISYFMYKYIL